MNREANVEALDRGPRADDSRQWGKLQGEDLVLEDVVSGKWRSRRGIPEGNSKPKGSVPCR